MRTVEEREDLGDHLVHLARDVFVQVEPRQHVDQLAVFVHGDAVLARQREDALGHVPSPRATSFGARSLGWS